jgi:hypothetical protein
MPGLPNKTKTVSAQATRLRLFTWTNCGDVTVTFQSFRFRIIRNMWPYVTHKNIVVFQYPPTQSHDCKPRSLRKKIQSVCGFVIALLLAYDSRNVGLEEVSVFVNWDPHILLQTADNRDARWDTEQPTDAGIRRRPWKRRLRDRSTTHVLAITSL